MTAPQICLVVLFATFPVAINGIENENDKLLPTFDSLFGDTDSEMATRLSALEGQIENSDMITKDILRRLTALEARQVEEDEALEEMERASAVQEESDAETAATIALSAAAEAAEAVAAAAEQFQDEDSRRDPQLALTIPEVKSSQRVGEDEALDEMKRTSAVQEESGAEIARTIASAAAVEAAEAVAAAAEQFKEEDSRRDPQVALALKSSQRDAARKVTKIPPKKTPSQLKVKAQRPVKKIKKTFTTGCGTPPPREGTTVNVAKGTAEYKCKPHHRNIGGKTTRSVCGVISGLWSPVDIFCSNFTTCTMAIDGRSVYNGTVSTTMSGYTCQRWDQQTPNRHWFMTDQSFQTTTGLGPETRSGASNYCRDPGVMVSDHTVWCYTTHPGVRSEPCGVPKCQVPK